MTLQIKKGDRIFKIIEAKTFGTERKMFISKIDTHGKISVLTYIFSEEDVKKDGTIENQKKRMRLCIKGIDREQFDFVININYQTYPSFQIIYEKDYSDKTLEDALDLMNSENIIYSNTPIKDIIGSLKNLN